MICAWNEFLRVLPEWLRYDVDKQGHDTLQELRLRINKPPELICCKSNDLTGRKVSKDDISYCINAASRYSPWAAESIQQGYITARGGHRIGICGQAIVQDRQLQGMRSITSVCIRIARDFPGLAASLADYTGSMLILGSPGTGKTTLLRDLIRQKSNKYSRCVAVVDERGELFPEEGGFETGSHTDVLTGCGKQEGITMLLRCMGPDIIAVDEITAEADSDALIRAGWSGVELLATAHAKDVCDLNERPIYKKLCDSRLFDWIIILHSDKTWSVERMSS